MKKVFKKLMALGVALSLLTFLVGPLVETALAAALLDKYNTMTSLKVSTASNHTIVFRTPTGAAENTDTITVTFPAGWTMNSLDYQDIDLAHSAGSQADCDAPSYTSDEVLAGTADATSWGAALSSQVITLTAPTDGVGVAAIATDACVQIEIGTNATTGTTGDTQITNDSSTGNATIAIAGGLGDSGDIVVNLITDDQIAVSATVDESMTFSIDDNSIGFATLSSAAARWATGDLAGSASDTSAHNFIVGTNASNGYTVTVNGATLTSGGDTITAIGSSATASSIGTEQFGIKLSAAGGIGAVSSPYATANYALDTAAFPDEVGSSTGASANTTFDVTYLANIASDTEAGAYTATLTYTATANY